MTPELKELMDFACNAGSATFLRHGQLRPVYHLIKRDGESVVMGAPHPNKDLAVAMLKAYMQINDIVRYVMMSEAWVAKMGNVTEAEAEAVKHTAATKGLADHPGREEVLHFIGEDAEGVVQASRDIIRPANGKPTLGPLRMYQSSHAEGRMIGLLPRPAGAKLS